MIKISPSILAADFTRLGDEIDSVKNTDYLHFDVMDGVFVPNISFGFPVLKAIRSITSQTLDVHLMIQSPSKYISRFIKAGADIITFHIEVAETSPKQDGKDVILSIIDEIHRHGKKAGISIKPKTPADLILPYIKLIDLVLVMTVEPGYGGQKFMHEMLPKVTEVREMIDRLNPACELEVDGGMNVETAKLCVDAGANVIVAGVDIFRATDRVAHIKELQQV